MVESGVRIGCPKERLPEIVNVCLINKKMSINIIQGVNKEKI